MLFLRMGRLLLQVPPGRFCLKLLSCLTGHGKVKLHYRAFLLRVQEREATAFVTELQASTPQTTSDRGLGTEQLMLCSKEAW